MKTRVKELREEREISQTTLATHVGCSQNTISKIELGECDPKASILIEMSKYFGVSVDYILYRSNHKNYTELYAHYGNQPDLIRTYVESIHKLGDKTKTFLKDMAERLVELEKEYKL